MKKREKRRGLALVLSLALCLGVLPGTAGAVQQVNPGWETTTGIQVTDGMEDTNWVDGGGVIQAKWELASKTLTLKPCPGAGTITAAANASGIRLPAGATLVVEDGAAWTVAGGEMTDGDATNGNGIYCAGELKVVIGVRASLTLRGGDGSGTSAIGGSGLYAYGKLAIAVESGGRLSAEGGGCAAGGLSAGDGIFSNGALTLGNDGAVRAAGGKRNGAWDTGGGLSARDSLTVSGGGSLRCVGRSGIYVWSDGGGKTAVSVAQGASLVAAGGSGSGILDFGGSVTGGGAWAGLDKVGDAGLALLAGLEMEKLADIAALGVTGETAVAAQDYTAPLDLSGVAEKTLYVCKQGSTYFGLALWSPGGTNRLDLRGFFLANGVKLPADKDAALAFSGGCNIASADPAVPSIQGGGALTLSAAGGADVFLANSNGTPISAGGPVRFTGGAFRIQAGTGAADRAVTVAGGTVELTGITAGTTVPALAEGKSLTVDPPAGSHGRLSVGNVVGSIVDVQESDDLLTYTETGAGHRYIKAEVLPGTLTPPPSPTPAPVPADDDDDGGDPTPTEAAMDQIKDARPGDTVEIDLPATGKLPGQVLGSAAGKDITLEIDAGNGLTWIIHGKDIPKGRLSALDLKVDTKGQTIPVTVLNALTGEKKTIQLALRHSGPFPFPLALRLDLGQESAGLYANLYHYDEAAGTLAFQAAAVIGGDGSAELPFAHASSYAVVIDEKSHAPVDFADVKEGDWCYEAVRYVRGRGLMAGVTETAFQPTGPVTRAQVWTVLARLDGIDTAGGEPWYAKAQAWAVEKGVSDGANPAAPVTRAQLVTMLYRYAQAAGMDVSAGEDTNILSYTDALALADWAVPAFQWACGAGIVSGTADGRLDPQAGANRGQLAAILQRFAEPGAA